MSSSQGRVPQTPVPQTPVPQAGAGQVGLAICVDTASILLFVLIGRREHDGVSAIGDILSTAAPFLVAALGAWLIVRVGRRPVWERPLAVSSGVMIWVVTVAAGMLLRRFVFGDGTALAFLIVATGFLGLCLVGWRVMVTLIFARSRW